MMLRRMEASASRNPWRDHVAMVVVIWLGFTGIAMTSRTAGSVVGLGGVLVAIGRIAKVDFRLWARSVAVATAFVLVASPGLLVGFDPGRMTLSWQIQAVAGARIVVCRSVLCAACTLLASQMVPFPRMMDFLLQIRVPWHVLELTRSTHRAIVVLEESLGGILRGMESRNGFSSSARTRRAVPLAVAALFLRAHDMSRRQEDALESRGWFGQTPVAHRHVKIWQKSTGLALALVALAAVVSHFLDVSCGN